MTVYDILFPPDEKYKSMVNISTLTKENVMKSLGCCYFEDIETYVSKLNIFKSNNYYITANGLKPYSKRSSEKIYTLNNIVLDFDFHGKMNPYERICFVEEFIFRIKRDLFDIQLPFNIFKPSVIVRTGRGVQIWWHIKSASSKLLFLYHNIIDKLAVIIKDFLTEYPDLEKNVEIDVTASKNSVGLFRLFGWNNKTHTKVAAEIISTTAYDINEFNTALSEHPTYKEYELKKQLQRQISAKHSESSRKGMATKKKNNSFDSLHLKRLAFIKWFSGILLDSVGKRDIMLFLAYNSGIQIMEKKQAQDYCKQLNQDFSEPLKKIDYIFKEIKRPYKISNARFYEMLDATEHVIKQFEELYKKQSVNLTRNAEIKKRKEERENKKDNAKQLLQKGMTYKQISTETGLSVSTIYRLAKEVGTKNKKERPWEILGMSRATYYRKHRR